MKVLKFSSPTCAPCKRLDENLKTFPPEGVEIISLDISKIEDKAVFMKYGVRSVPTVIEIGEEGKPLNRWGGMGFVRFLEERKLSIEDIIVNGVEEVINKQIDKL